MNRRATTAEAARLRTVHIATDAGRWMRAELASPAGAPRGAVIVVHELFGLTDHLRDVTRRLAGEGYVALALDLFGHRGGRVRCLMAELGRMLTGRGPRTGTMADLAAAQRWLAAHPWHRELPSAVVGFCWGGGVVLGFVTRGEQLDAAAAFYGRNPPLEAVDAVSCPVLAVYGEKDRFITPGADALRAAMERAGKICEAHVVPGVGHSFMNDRRGNHPEAVEEGWRTLLDFFERHLQRPQP